MMLNETDANSSSLDDVNIKYKLYIIVPIMWSTIIFLGLLGNGTIIYIILKRRLFKDSCTNCYIINVAIADLCFTLICVPVTMTAYIYKEWMFGAFMCSFQMLLMFSSVQAACLTLTAMTVDRYLAVLYPFKSIEYRTTKLAFMTNIIIWIVSFTLSFPYFLYYKQTKEPTYCTANFPKWHFKSYNITINMEVVLTIYTVLISYVLPLTTIIFCYMRMILRIYGKSNNQRLLFEDAKTTLSSSSNCNIGGGSVRDSVSAGDGLRINVNRQVRVSLDNFGKSKSPPGSAYKNNTNTRGGSIPLENLIGNSPRDKTSSSNANGGSNNGRLKHKGDVDKSMEEFLEELDEMSKAESSQDSSKSPPLSAENDLTVSSNNNNNNNNNNKSSSAFARNHFRSNSEKSEVRWSSSKEGEDEKMLDDGKTSSSQQKRQPSSDELRMMSASNSASHLNVVVGRCKIRNSYSVSSQRATIGPGGRISNMSNVEAMRKQKQKILLLIATVSITFAMTWFPAHFIQMWRVVFEESFPYNEGMYIIKFMAHTLSYSNSFLNPLIYVFMGSRFRNHIHSEFSYLYDLFLCRCCCGGGGGGDGSSQRRRRQRLRNRGPSGSSMGSLKSSHQLQASPQNFYSHDRTVITPNTNMFNRLASNSPYDATYTNVVGTNSLRCNGGQQGTMRSPHYVYYDSDSLTIAGLNNNIRNSIR